MKNKGGYFSKREEGGGWEDRDQNLRTKVLHCMEAKVYDPSSRSALLTLVNNSSRQNGFCKNGESSRRIPDALNMASVNPDIRTVRIDGNRSARYPARSVPLVPGITMSVNTKSTGVAEDSHKSNASLPPLATRTRNPLRSSVIRSISRTMSSSSITKIVATMQRLSSQPA